MRQWQKEKLRTAIKHLRDYCSSVEFLHEQEDHPVNDLKKEVAAIQDSIEFLESIPTDNE